MVSTPSNLPKIEAEKLIAWFDTYARDLPWRQNRTPYRVWISEIMLQQTQVATVINYFNRWMEAFPDIQTLADAPESQVIKLWEGLGYYSRARNLHKTAKIIQAEYQGKFPESTSEISKLPGLGPYTTNAVLAFAFQKPFAPVDGNVIRVLSRYYTLEWDFAKSPPKRHIHDLAQEILPKHDRHWVYSEALIELGAKICQKKPQCSQCPLQTGCRAFKTQKMDQYPIKSPKPKITKIERLVGLIRNSEQAYLLRKVPEGEVMAGLYEFYYMEANPDHPQGSRLKEWEEFTENWGLEKVDSSFLGAFPQSFTRYKATLHTFETEIEGELQIAGYAWIPEAEVSKLPLVAAHRKIWQVVSKDRLL